MPAILQYPHAALRTACARIFDFDEVREIVSAMHAAIGGQPGVKCIGLAANQVGICKRVVIVHQGTQWVTLVNPVIVDAKGEQALREGCMSFNFGLTTKLRTRPHFIRVEYQDEKGNSCRRTAKGINAAAIAHEIEHLDGKMFFDVEKAA